MSTVPLLLAGQWTHPSADSFAPVHKPSKGEVIAEVPMCGGAEVDAAVQSAQGAYASWSKTPVYDRVAVLFKYRHLLDEHFDELSRLIVRENGKTLEEARGDMRRGLEVADFAVSGESKHKEEGAFVDVWDQQVDAEVAELVAVVDEPVDDGLGIFGGDDGAVVGADLFAGDDFDAPVFRSRLGDPVEAAKDRREAAATVLLIVELESGLGCPLQLVEDVIVADGYIGQRGYREDPGEVRGAAAILELNVGCDGPIALDE